MVEMKWALLVLLAGPLAGQTSLSIYSDGRVVVRRTLAQGLEKGRNALTLQLEDLDPATLFSPDTSAAIVSAVVRAPTDREAALRHAVGQTLAFVVERSDGRRDTVRASVVRVTPPQYRLSDGRFLLSEPGEPLFPSGLVRAAPEVSLLLEATRPRPRTELAWVAQGASWEASYQVVLAGAKCEVSGTATILAQSLRADSADVQLVAGSIARARPEPKLMDYVSGVARVQMQAAEIASPPAEQAVGEPAIPGQLDGDGFVKRVAAAAAEVSLRIVALAALAADEIARPPAGRRLNRLRCPRAGDSRRDRGWTPRQRFLGLCCGHRHGRRRSRRRTDAGENRFRCCYRLGSSGGNRCWSG